LQKSAFFNSIGGDRRYTAEDFVEYFASFIGNGVFPNPSTGLQAMSNNNMTVTVKAGKAWINGYFYVAGDQIVSIALADGVLARIDRIVVRWSHTNRNITLAVKQGSLASNPVAPTLQRDADIFELGLADIAVNRGATSILQMNITDLRLNPAFCGIVSGLVNQVDTTTLSLQLDNWLAYLKTASQGELQTIYDKFDLLYNTNVTKFNNQLTANQSTFDNWFQTILNILDESVAANLLNLINQKQAIINVSGILKGTGSGGVAAAAWTDIPLPEYSFHYDGNKSVRYAEIPVAGSFTGTWTNEPPTAAITGFLKGDAVAGIIYAAVQVANNQMRRYDTVNKTWLANVTGPTDVKNFPFPAAKGNLYAMGGDTSSQTTGTTTNQEYNPVTNTWAFRAYLLVLRTYATAAVIGNMVYLMGSNSTSSYTRNDVYDADLNTWANKAAIPSGTVTWCDACAIGTRVYFEGKYYFDTIANAWTATTNPSTARTYFVFDAVGDKAYALGGQTGSGTGATYHAVAEEYNPTTNTWRNMASAPTARSTQGSAVVGNKIYIYGGGTASGVYTNANEGFMPTTMQGFLVGGMSAGQKLQASGQLAVDVNGNVTLVNAGSLYTASARCKIYAPLGAAVTGNVIY